ncbi:MAG: NusG domain II-containing protein [Ruminococcus sp.]|nr:NusG domain II-containing protein [Ruminococcus sp.]
MNRRDFVAIGIIIILSTLGFLFFNLNRSDGEKVKISVGSKTYGTYSLSENNEIKVKTDSGFNTVIIESGSVFIKDADCRDKYCVNQGKIKNGSIICLPHRLVVEIEKDDSSIDAVAR